MTSQYVANDIIPTYICGRKTAELPLDIFLTVYKKFLAHALAEEQNTKESPCAAAQGPYVPGGSAAAGIVAAAVIVVVAAVAAAVAATVTAAAVVTAVAAAATVTAVAAAPAAAAAEQDDQDDDPVATEAVVIPHIHIPPVRCEAGKGLSSSYAGGAMWCQLILGEFTSIRAEAS